MTYIRYKPSNFPTDSSPYLLQPHDLRVNGRDLVWGSITVGKRNLFEVFRYGLRSWHDIFFKWHLICAHIESTDDGSGDKRYLKTRLYEYLDPTEKAVVSYYLGMAISKVFAEKRLKTPWVYHLSRLSPAALKCLPGKSNPDLCGQNTDLEWAVIEAKGRSNRFSGSSLKAAKKQTQQVLSINGDTKILRVATQSYFDKYLELAVDDPSEANDDAKNFQIDEGMALRGYYLPLIRFISRSEEIIDSNFGAIRVVEIHRYGLKIGLLESIIKTRAKRGLLLEWRAAWLELLKQPDPNDNRCLVGEYGKVYNDGVFVALAS